MKRFIITFIYAFIILTFYVIGNALHKLSIDIAVANSLMFIIFLLPGLIIGCLHSVNIKYLKLINYALIVLVNIVLLSIFHNFINAVSYTIFQLPTYLLGRIFSEILLSYKNKINNNKRKYFNLFLLISYSFLILFMLIILYCLLLFQFSWAPYEKEITDMAVLTALN